MNITYATEVWGGVSHNFASAEIDGKQIKLGYEVSGDPLWDAIKLLKLQWTLGDLIGSEDEAVERSVGCVP